MHLYLMKVSNYPFKNNHKFYINWSHWMALVIQTNLFSRSKCKQICLTNSGSFTNILSSNSVSSTLFSPAFVLSLHTTYLCDLMEHFSPAFPLITPQQDSGMGCPSEAVFMWRTVPSFMSLPCLQGFSDLDGRSQMIYTSVQTVTPLDVYCAWDQILVGKIILS